MTRIGNSGLDVFPLALGSSVFGWTTDERTAFQVLDAYTAAGGNFIDTADLYAGGVSEAIIGRWLASRGRRDDVIIATKVGIHPDFRGLKPANIRAAVERSLNSLGTYIDLYYTHFDDITVPVEDIIGTLDELVRARMVRYIGASNITARRLAASLEYSDRAGLAKYVVLQQQYNLVEREEYEGALRNVVAAHGLSSTPYFSLAKGFLTGKYRPGVRVDSPRASSAAEYLAVERGPRVLAVLDDVAAAHGVPQASVALAWLAAQPTVVAPIASARSLDQLPALLASVDLKLTAEELARLTQASA